MDTVDVKIFNLLIHYGYKGEKNLLDLLSEILFDQMKNEEITEGRAMYSSDVEIIKLQNRHYLAGYFYRESTLKWDTVPGTNRRHKKEPGKKDVLPFARFFIDLEDHRIFWATQRGLSYSPSAYHFKGFVKQMTLPYIRDFYRAEAEASWKSKKKKRRGETKSKFISEYLADHNATRKTFSVELIPEVSKDKVKDLLAAKNILIKKAVFFPSINNVTKDDCVRLFTTVGKLGSESEAVSEVVLDPIDDKKGLKKEPIFKLMEYNDNKQLLKFEFTAKDTDRPNSRPFKIANTTAESDNRIQRSETLQAEFKDDTLLASVLEKVKYLKERGVSASLKRDVANKIKGLIFNK